MKDPLVQIVRDFLSPRWQPGKPLLLGYSGGPDSKALLYLLLECRSVLPIEIRLVHIDHGWRSESAFEAEEICKEAERLGLKLDLCRLCTGAIPSRNAEAAGREQRLAFFRKVYTESGAQGLLLAHQADDQAETVLKRLFEGAHPMYWGGIEPDGQLDGMRILRPLLGIAKKELVQWLEKKKETPFEDATNLDPRFLRGRLRAEIIPILSERFGKQIAQNLSKAADSSREVHAYLAKQCSRHLAKRRVVAEGIHWDLTECVEKVELKWMLKEWAGQESLHISHEMLQLIVEVLVRREANKQFPVKQGILYLNRGCLVYKPKV